MAAIAAVFTIGYVANMLGEDEDWLYELSIDMFPGRRLPSRLRRRRGRRDRLHQGRHRVPAADHRRRTSCLPRTAAGQTDRIARPAVLTEWRLCFFGDSMVNGTGDDTCLGWVGRICATARRSGRDLTCYNLGIRRDTSADVLARWQREAETRLRSEHDGRLVFRSAQMIAARAKTSAACAWRPSSSGKR